MRTTGTSVIPPEKCALNDLLTDVLLLISSQTKGRGKYRKICPTEIFRETRKLELATTGAELGLHRGSSIDWQSPADFRRILSRLHRLRAFPFYGIKRRPAQHSLFSYTSLSAAWTVQPRAKTDSRGSRI